MAAQPSGKTHVVVLYANSGGGHVAAARTLRAVLEATGNYRVTLVNPYKEVFPHFDIFKHMTGRTGEAFYNEKILRDGRPGLTCWLFYAMITLNIAVTARSGTKLLAATFDKLQPDVLISVMPLTNTVMLRAIKLHEERAQRNVHGVILMTDWSEMVPNVWFPRGYDYHAICGTQESARQAKQLPGQGPTVHEMSGLLIDPAFAHPPEKSIARTKLGLAVEGPVITMIYGGEGSQRMLTMARALAKQPPQAQVVFICGRNETLRHDLQAAQLPFTHQICGFTDQVATYLAASDIFVGKPGPGSVSEALVMNLWMLLDTRMALPQEASVLRFVEKSDAGLGFSSVADFLSAIDAALKKPEIGLNGKATQNSSSQEAVQIIENIVKLRNTR